MTPAISITNLSKVYKGKRKQKVQALKELNLSVAKGEIYGFLGPNGAGKSTTIKILLGLTRPSNGSALLNGYPVGSVQSRGTVGFLPENPALYDFLTASEYLAMVGRCFRMSHESITTQSERVLNLLDLIEASHRPIRGYSKGMVQRLAFAQTLLHDPDLYILDEPMSGLDPVGRVLVKDIMQDLKRKGKTVFFSTHVISDVEAVCDRVAIIAKGELRSESSVQEIIAAGLDGYLVRLNERLPDGYLNQYRMEHSDDRSSLFVPYEEFSHVMRQLDQDRIQVQMVEPQRKSLEDFFLKMIKQESS
jgi:ABC-2 type transport system ATP-binding protein